MEIEITEKEQTMIKAYFGAIDFSETGDIDQPDSGSELDDVFKRESIIDCLAFYSRTFCYLPTDEEEQIGFDFWLTRNGHGTGFWDREDIYGDMKDHLTKIAESFGGADAVFE